MPKSSFITTRSKLKEERPDSHQPLFRFPQILSSPQTPISFSHFLLKDDLWDRPDSVQLKSCLLLKPALKRLCILKYRRLPKSPLRRSSFGQIVVFQERSHRRRKAACPYRCSKDDNVIICRIEAIGFQFRLPLKCDCGASPDEFDHTLVRICFYRNETDKICSEFFGNLLSKITDVALFPYPSVMIIPCAALGL